MEIFNFGNTVVNNYVYKTEGGYVLIDTGYEKNYNHFKRCLKRNNLDFNDFFLVFITHAHDDHVGYLNRLLSDFPKFKLVLSEKALPNLHLGQNSNKGGPTSGLALLVTYFLGLTLPKDHKFPAIEKRFDSRLITINEENIIDLGKELGGKIIETPGHTEDSISLLLLDGSLFCGDAAMNGFPSHHNISVWAENKDDYKSSWNKIIKTKAKKLFPGHGKPFKLDNIKANLNYVDKIKIHR